MKFVKNNLFLIICSVIVLLALVALYWPIGTTRDKLVDKMGERLGLVKQANDLATQSIAIPGRPVTKGPVTDGVIQAKLKAQTWAKEQADSIATLASQDNEKNRTSRGNGRIVPLLAGVPQDGFLPKIQGDAQDFKISYEKLYPTWLTLLIDPNPANPTATTGAVPTLVEIDAAITAEETQRLANVPRLPTGQAINNVASKFTKREREDYIKNFISDRAQHIVMYATPNSFQMRPWANGERAPNETEIFQGFVDTWIQQDVVNTILALNKGSKSVESSPVKRLDLIAIGATAAASNPSSAAPGATRTFTGSTGAGELFLTQGSLAASGTPAPVAKPASIDFSKSMTGRVGSDKFDVTQFKIVLYIDPSHLNRFIQELYRQNNGYTVLGVPKVEAVDPFEAASNGYLYGHVPVVRVELLVEALFFRGWTEALMPDAYKNALGIPLIKPAGPTGPARAGM